MAVNLVNSNDIEVTQTENNIQLNTTVDMQTLESNVETNTSNISTNTTDITNLKTYSTSEINTGKIWINGKPIYRKCINVGVISGTDNVTINHNAQNVDEYVSVTARGQSGSSYYNVPFAPNVAMFSNAGFGIRAISPTELQIYAGASGHSFIAIIEYTKTTD